MAKVSRIPFWLACLAGAVVGLLLAVLVMIPFMEGRWP